MGSVEAQYSSVFESQGFTQYLWEFLEYGVDSHSLRQLSNYVAGKQIFRSAHKRRYICFLVFAFLLSGSSGCSHLESRRAQAIARGNHLFTIHCSGCHGRRRLDLGKVPPDLHGVFDRRFLPSGRFATDDVVRSTILTGRSGIMPSFEGNLSDEDIQDIILYLHTLKAAPKVVTPAASTERLSRFVAVARR
jgi:cytochrome c2